MQRKAVGFIVLILSLFLISSPTQAAVFDLENILDDRELEDAATMSEAEIQEFLLHRGTLGAYVTPDIDGVMKPAATIINRVARTYRLNPQFLLALLQREQGLIEGATPTEAQLTWATGYAVCDRCDKDHPELQEYSGFTNQVEQAAKRLREKFLTEIDTLGKTFTGWGPGMTKYADGVPITPRNRATAALYTYTPHIAGNRLLWGIWQRWFSLRYPDGTLLQTDADDDTVWLIQSGLKRPIASLATLFSRFNPTHIITVAQEELSQYEEGRPILFPDFSLLRSPRGTVYLIRSDRRHGFPSRDVFQNLGFHDDEVIDVTWSDLDLYTEGDPLSIAAAYPRGALLQNKDTGGVYYIEAGYKHPIWSKELMRTRFPSRVVTAVNPTELEGYPTREPVLFSDGELIGLSGQPDVFIVSNKERRPIPSIEIFEQMGWKWEYVVWTNEKAVMLHPLGAPITLERAPDATITTNYTPRTTN